MIISFYDKDFKGLQNNASLVVDKDSYELIKRPVEMNDLSCKCEPFTENIQPTFLVVSDDLGRYVYGCLAGIPLLNDSNQTEINGTDLKSMLSSDVLLEKSSFDSVNDVISFIFNEWNSQVNQNSFNCQLVFNENVNTVALTDFTPTYEKDVYNAWDEIQACLKYYNLFIDTNIDLVNKTVFFRVGRTMYRQLNIKLWEYGVKNYGKWVADVNECQGYYHPNDTSEWTAGYKWILTSQNKITIDESKRDIFPIKRKIVVGDKSLEEVNRESLTKLLNSLYNENIEIATTNINPDFESRFEVYVRRGENKYKDLPCGELHFNSNGLCKVQIGYRYTGVEFI